MTEVSLTGLINTLLVIFIILVVIRFFSRFILPSLLKFMLRRVQNDMTRRHKKHPSNNRDTKQKKSQRKPNKDKKIGEYIDFEEIE